MCINCLCYWQDYVIGQQQAIKFGRGYKLHMDIGMQL